MIRIHVICEGTTEYNFVNKILYPYFLIAEDIGLTKLREECTHLNNWLWQLENLER
jgi:hypothetical protein